MRFPFVVSALLLAPLACSSSSPAPAAGDAAPPLPPGVTASTLSMRSHVKAGTESHTCQLVTAPNTAPAFVVGASHTYTPGSHHMVLFRTDYASMPTGGDQPQDCYEMASGGPMSHVRGILYAAQTPSASMTYPPGVGLPVAAGEILMMQTHYLNASDQDLDAEADLTLDLSDGTGVTTHAGVFFFYDPFIDVPPASTAARATMRCLVPSDVTLFTAASHYHARGNDYAAYLDPPSGPAAASPFYTSHDWDHPTPLASPLSVPAGSRIRFSCGYANTDPSKEYFQGQSAADDEMCMFFAIYYPETDAKTDFCETSADMFGTGTTGCAQTLSCVRACAASGAPTPSPSPAHPDVDPCYQKCFVSSCPDASAKLFALEACTRSSCAADCADPQSAACQQCAVTSCGDETSACFNDACP